jgi:predicted transcriptional regulator
MTINDELHALVDRLTERDAHEALDYLRARLERDSNPSQVFIDESQRGLDEALDPNAVRIPHDAVRAWLLTWGTPEEGAADVSIQKLEDRLRREAQGAAGT